MTAGLFAVLDMAARRYIDPFNAPTIEFAIRGFREACESDGHQFGKFPEDYVLYHVGEWNAELGELVGIVPTKIAAATNFTPGER